ncbi:MAG: hypothetical protein Q8941_18360 [Bacteroidota bacterium]|nr:hypothetical protein [Bacteroidota bacterium]
MSETIQVIRDSFIKELREGDFWRIMRRETFIDLIKLSLIKYQETNNSSNLVDIINLSLKVKILSAPQLMEIAITNNPEQVYNQFNKEKELITRLYDEALQKAIINLDSRRNKEAGGLYGEVEYLKMINQLKIKDYSDEIFDGLICTSINLLADRI